MSRYESDPKIGARVDIYIQIFVHYFRLDVYGLTSVDVGQCTRPETLYYVFVL